MLNYKKQIFYSKQDYDDNFRKMEHTSWEIIC